MTNDERTESVDDAPGWTALEAGIAAVVGDIEPLHWGTNRLPDQDGIYGLNAYPLDEYWLLLTLGLSELFEKVTDDPATSGWGIELTMRVPRGANDDEMPPPWALELLNRLSGYVFSTGRVFAAGHRMDLGGPITGGQQSTLTGLAFATDPAVAQVHTPLGLVDLVAVVGITAEELGMFPEEQDASPLIARLAATNPLLLTDPSR